MSKIRQIINSANMRILIGLILIVFVIGSAIRQYIQDKSTIVLGNAESGLILGDPNAFRPPLQMELTTPSKPEDLVGNGDGQVGEVVTPQPHRNIPDRLIIESIKLDVPVLAEHYKEIYQDDQTYIQWRVPFRRASGWHDTTAPLGDPGNTVFNGHHNAYGEVFKDLVDLKEGDLIEVYSGESVFEYQVKLVLLLPEKYQSMDDRIKNASWIMPTPDERLTLVTCWPPESNTHRLIVVAFPVKKIPPAAQ